MPEQEIYIYNKTELIGTFKLFEFLCCCNHGDVLGIQVIFSYTFS